MHSIRLAYWQITSDDPRDKCACFGNSVNHRPLHPNGHFVRAVVFLVENILADTSLPDIAFDIAQNPTQRIHRCRLLGTLDQIFRRQTTTPKRKIVYYHVRLISFQDRNFTIHISNIHCMAAVQHNAVCLL